MVGAWIAAVFFAQGSMDVMGSDVGVRVQRNLDGTLSENYLAKDSKGKMRVILTSPSLSDLAIKGAVKTSPLLQTGSEGLFESPPSFGFTEWSKTLTSKALNIELRAKGDGHSIVKRIEIPTSGNLMKVSVACDFQRENPVIRYLLDTYAFAPDGKPMKAYGKPDATFLPGIRPRKDGVVGDHFFRSPIATVQERELAATIMPDLDVLKVNRYINTILDIDAANGVVDAPLMSYGFADYKLVGHVYYTNDSSMTKPAPPQLLFAHDILLDAKAEPYGAYQKAAKYQWDRYGHRYFDKVLPQAMPFEEYAKVCYPAALNEKETGGWFEHELNGHVVGGMPSGWGRMEGWVSWQPWFNQLRSAWGMRWWGKKLGNKDWEEKADKMLNLALAAPMDRGAVPTTYLSKTKGWKGSLITPDPKCYYDLTNMAWKGIWLLRWLEFEDCPRRDDIVRQCQGMALLMASKQNVDGSFPTWLDKNLNVVPVLDRSAQSALPAWFLAAYATKVLSLAKADFNAQIDRIKDLKRADNPNELNEATWRLQQHPFLENGLMLSKAAQFLAEQVVDGQYWYDFETFFSCSPKACLQRDGQHNHENMRDPHTLQAPQNTLCMHWTAEALQSISNYVEIVDQRVVLLDYPSTKVQKTYDEFKLLAKKRAFWQKQALKAIDTMTLSQNVWPISYRKAAYTYGGFGVQNSDGEYNDARQAQFGDTLVDFGAALGRQDYFERGVAAIRASMALINHPKHIELGIYPNPNYPLGLQPENTGHGGTDQQNGRTGPDWGELSGLTSMAYLLHTYGGAYVHKDGWRVGIDGVEFHPDGKQIGTIMSINTPTFELEVVRPGGRTKQEVVGRPRFHENPFFWHLPEENKISVSWEIYPWLQPSVANLKTNKGDLQAGIVGAGAADGEFGPIRMGTIVGSISPGFTGSVAFHASIGGWPLNSEPFEVFVDPTFDMKDWRMPGWTFNCDFLHWPVKNPRRFNWGNDGLPFIGTCEDGRGAFDDEFTGTVESPWFTVSKPVIRLKVGAGSGEGVSVELVSGKESPKRVYVARGKNNETMEEVVWDVSKLKGQSLRIRIVDQEKGPWGHINVGNIRCVDK